MDELISKNALYEKVSKLVDEAYEVCKKSLDENEFKIWSTILSERLSFKYDIEDAPAIPIPVEPIKHGKWEVVSIRDEGYDINYRCSCCKSDDIKYQWNYCPDCGAKMESCRIIDFMHSQEV